LLGFATVVLLAVAAWVLTRRWLAARADRRGGLTDEAIRRIEAEGRVERDEPLDLREIEAEERKFWEEESWDGSDEW